MHYRTFDLWRFVAAMLIMVYHYLYFAPIELWNVLGPIVRRPQALLDLFFMISGFLVMTRYGRGMESAADFAGFLRRRLATLYPLHLLTLAFFVPIALAGAAGLMTLNNPARWDLSLLPLHLTLTHAWGLRDELAFNFPSWSLSAELLCYLLFPAILLLHRRLGPRGLLVALLAWVVAVELLWASGRLGEEHWSRANNFGAYRALIGFLAGCLVALAVEARRVAVTRLWPGQAVLLLAVALMLVEAPPLLPIATLALALFLAAAAETARPCATLFLAAWSPLLRTSFGIYLWHMVFAAIFYQLLWNKLFAGAGSTAFLAYTLLPVTFTMAAAFLSRPFERWAYALLTGGERARQGVAAA
ncbi:acyltransferase family protein [Aureimonas populi]|uniref:Acyltransferase family protein n=1 Tax=Aureimonas populi TaxID=1701758 RepID=A0ABW5CNX6_9HYPH|nr:acyltransferase [Aureimonas populi]